MRVDGSGHPLEFRVLGPLQVLRHGAPVTITAPKLRTLLGCLLLNAGTVVPAHRLIQRLWEDAPASGGRNALQVYVTRLRDVLRGLQAIEAHDGGYTLVPPPMALDLERFNHLAAQARTATDAEAELEFLRRAAALWRGPILGDLNAGSLHTTDVPLRQERCLDVLERRFELELEHGSVRAVIPDLTGLLADFPLRENLRGHLMRALASDGRRVEALESFRSFASDLRTEFGLEPGSEISAVHQVILTGSPTPRQATPHRVPHQLPSPATDFVGQAALLADTEHALRAGGTPAVVLSGPPGIGKSAVALHLASRLRDRFPDGLLYACLDGARAEPTEPADVLLSFILALSPGTLVPASRAARGARFRELVSGRRILIVLDDVGDIEQIRELLPSTTDAAVLITSRHPLLGLPHALRVPVPPLTADEGAALLRGMIGEHRASAEPAETADIVTSCGGMPLALRVAGIRLQAHPDASLSLLAGRLRDNRGRLSEFEAGPTSVRSTLALSYTALAAPARTAFRRLGLLRAGTFAAWTLGTLTDSSNGERLVEHLLTAGMIEPAGIDTTGEPRYRAHDLIALYARGLAAQESEAANRQACSHMLDTMTLLGNAAPAETRLPGALPPDPADNCHSGLTPHEIARLAGTVGACASAERRQIMVTVKWACRYGWVRRAAAMADSVLPLIEPTFDIDQLIDTYTTIRAAALNAGEERIAWRAEYHRANLLQHSEPAEAAGLFRDCAQAFHRLGAVTELDHALAGIGPPLTQAHLDTTATADCC